MRIGRIWSVLALLSIGAAPAPEIQLWRLDCGTMRFDDANYFSDTHGLPSGPLTISNGCYLIRHGDTYMLWDAGIPTDFLGPLREAVPGVAAGLVQPLAPQLARLGVRPDQIGILGISHNHLDHVGQAASFPRARLLIGAGDWADIQEPNGDPTRQPARLAPWISGGAPVETLTADKDVFGDGSVVMLRLPGHTPGHYALLVRLPRMGPLLLSGDLYHQRAQLQGHDVPPMNLDRADTLASFDRFDRLARNLNAEVVIQHEPNDIAKLPSFPAAAE